MKLKDTKWFEDATVEKTLNTVVHGSADNEVDDNFDEQIKFDD